MLLFEPQNPPPISYSSERFWRNLLGPVAPAFNALHQEAKAEPLAIDPLPAFAFQTLGINSGLG